jgi:membrane associated rhomboid family serine protease
MSSLPPPPLPTPPVIEHCYRHPDRETGRKCTRCGKSACGECLVQVSVGSHCLDCVKAARPDVKTRAKFWNARQPTLVTYALIAINAAVYLWTASSRLHEARIALFKPAVADGEYYRLVTSGFLHFGIFHIGMNMLLLFQLGQLLEPAIGRLRFGLLYFASLLAGSLGALMVSHDFAVTGGASGAVFGLMTAAAIGLHRRGVNIFQTGIGMVLILNLFLTFTIPNISIGGHVGGAIAGALSGFVILAPRQAGMPTWASYVAPIAVILVSVMGSVAVAG